MKPETVSTFAAILCSTILLFAATMTAFAQTLTAHSFSATDGTGLSPVLVLGIFRVFNEKSAEERKKEEERIRKEQLNMRIESVNRMYS